MNLYFAGCARDCANVVAANILALLSLADSHPWVNVRVFVAENDSRDSTRRIIEDIARRDARLIPLLLDDLDKVIPRREARIAFCRDFVLAQIAKHARQGLYIPVDLDSGIARSLEASSFMRVCRFVDAGGAVGVFPSSSPCYYDIHALRHREWCPVSCWRQIRDAKVRGSLMRLWAYICFVSFRQTSHAHLRGKGLISVDSAFGGIGVYSLAKVCRSAARYSSVELESDELCLCEHVVFNQFLDSLYIDSAWVVEAPLEHVEFRALPFHRKAWRVLLAMFEDVKTLVRRAIYLWF